MTQKNRCDIYKTSDEINEETKAMAETKGKGKNWFNVCGGKKWIR